jgi:N-acetylglutamate synthase-like GNAT family acetyltransferase
VTGPALCIRAAREDELAALTEIVLEAKRHWGYSDDLIELWRDGLAISPELARHCSVIVAERDGERVGVAAVRVEGTEAEIEHLWVRPAAMGAGVGRRLFEHVVRIAQESGVKSMIVVSDPNAESFYEHLGARRVDFVPSTPEGRELPRLRIDL